MQIPEWMSGEFEKGQCPYCKKTLSDKGVQTHGIREELSKSKKKVRYSHFYDYKCPKCKNRSVFSFPTTFKEFINDMVNLANQSMPTQLSDGTRAEVDDQPSTERKSGITDEEVEEVKKSLDESEDLKEFFRKIGIDMKEPKSEKDDENK